MHPRKTNERETPASQVSTREVPTKDDIAKIRWILMSKPRDLLLFDLLAQTGIKLKDALTLKVKDLLGVEIGAKLPVLIDSANKLRLTKELSETLTFFFQNTQIHPKDYLFKSRKKSNPLSLTSASHLIRKWFRDAGITRSPGARGLRKYYETSLKMLRDEQLDNDSIEIHSLDNSTVILKPVEASTLHQTVYQVLFQAIIAGNIPPGDRLVIGKIAKQMKVSPMPVREALHRLQAKGFLSHSIKRAYVVNKLSSDNLNEITKLRLILEPLAAKNAALYRDNKTIDFLKMTHDDYIGAIKNRDSDIFLEINRLFHFTIYREAKMPILFELIEILWGRASPYQHILMRESAQSDLEWSIKTHSAIIDALQHQNSDSVEKAIRTDLSIAADNLMLML